MKQKIEIEVPEGKIAIWDEKKQKICFKNQEKWRQIKTFDDVLKYLVIDKNDLKNVYSPLLCEYVGISKWQLIMKAFIRASNDKCNLTGDNVFYPYFYILDEDKVNHKLSDRIYIKYKIYNSNETFFLVGGAVTDPYNSGLEISDNYTASQFVFEHLGLRAFSLYEVAEHVSKYFVKELFEETVGWRISSKIEWL